MEQRGLGIEPDSISQVRQVGEIQIALNSLVRCCGEAVEQEAANSFWKDQEFVAGKFHRKGRELCVARVHRKEAWLGLLMKHLSRGHAVM